MSVCRECRSMFRRQPQALRALRSISFVARPSHRTPFTTGATPLLRILQDDSKKRTIEPAYISRRTATTLPPPPVATTSTSHAIPDLAAIHARIDELANTVLKPVDNPIPAEQRTLYVLEQLESLIDSLQHAKSPTESRSPQKPTSTQDKQATATSALLGSVNARRHPSHLTAASLLDSIGTRAEQVLRHPNVFITPAILKSYISLQTQLHSPMSFPDAFDLYARKPIPRLSGSNEVTYQKANPDKVSSAIDTETAEKALSQAILSNNLPLAIDIITTTFSAPAYKRNKILRQALIPISGLAIAPLAAYTIAMQFSLIQTSMDPSQATTVAFAGIMTYMTAVASMGYIAVTTANDQMRRVTWATGVPLWERWIREEERAALDTVAMHWGFEDLARRGDEEGVEWDSLREFVGRRGMVLDRVELMDGME